ncbi:MAG: hypothetical protein AB1Z67_03535 [Candidatus Limnocylindrales bacterium]
MVRPFRATLLALATLLLMASAVTAQVATLATPDPDAAATEAPTEELDGEQAILDLVACLRDNGLDIPDPQFGPDGPTFADPSVLMDIDLGGDTFLGAMEACEEFLTALQPEVDPEQQAEQIEQQLVLAECMRREGIDEFPDPDPVRGFTFEDMTFDPFDLDFQVAFATCAAEMGFDPAGGPPGVQ